MNPGTGGPRGGAGGLRRPPVFYGWVLVATAFVTMGIVVNARTAFSLFFPAILDEFGWSRGLTAATFTTGLLASNLFTPFLGLLMDRLGPRVLFPAGLSLMSLGLALATAAREPWHLHLTLGVLVAGATVLVGYMGHSLLLPNWFVRQRGLALGVAFSGVGVGSFLLLPWIQGLIGRVGWRGACWMLAALLALVVVPLNALLPRRRPEELDLRPDGDEAPGGAAPPATVHVVDPAWAGTEWTLARAVRTSRFWWLFLCYFTGLFAWYAVQIHQTKYLLDLGFSGELAAYALGLVGLTGIVGQIAWGYLSDRVGREWAWTASGAGFLLCYLALLALPGAPGAMARLRDGRRAGAPRVRARLGLRRDPDGALPGGALRLDLRRAERRLERRRRSGPLGDGRGLRSQRKLRARVLARRRVQRRVGRRRLAGGATEGAARRRARTPMKEDLTMTDPVDAPRRGPPRARALPGPLGLGGERAYTGGWRARPVPDEWAPVEIVCHLRDEEAEDFGARVRVILDGGGTFTPIDPERWAVARRYRDANPDRRPGRLPGSPGRERRDARRRRRRAAVGVGRESVRPPALRPRSSRRLGCPRRAPPPAARGHARATVGGPLGAAPRGLRGTHPLLGGRLALAPPPCAADPP